MKNSYCVYKLTGMKTRQISIQGNTCLKMMQAMHKRKGGKERGMPGGGRRGQA